MKLDQWFRRNENTWERLPADLRGEFPAEHWPLIETEFKYQGHLVRQLTQVERMSRQEAQRLPEDVDYGAITGLKREAQLRLNEVRPATLGQASRIPGITPADVAILMIWLEKQERSSRP